MKWLQVALLLLLAGCTYPTVVLAGYQRFAPDPEWAAWHAELRECAAKRGPEFGQLRWFRAELIHLRPDDQEEWQNLWGLWIAPDEIILHTDSGDSTVRHEMLHAILQSGEHPVEFTTCLWSPPR